MTRTRRLLAALLALSFMLTIPGQLVPTTTMDGLPESGIENTQDDAFTVSEQELTTWYHDGSNTTGWVQAIGTWPINSTGTELYSNITATGTDTYHSVFSYSLETPFVVGNDLKWEMQFNYTPNSNKYGGINAMLYAAGNEIVWRFAGSVVYSGGGMWAVNYYSMSEYDQENQIGSPTNISMWYNTSNDETQTDIGDGVVSTSEHAGETRTITSVVLDFWFEDDGSRTYADLRMDWMRITGGERTEIDSPSDVTMEYSEAGRSITWHPEGYFPETYELLINGTSEDLGAWNGSALEFPLTGLDPGLYEYELEVTDELGMTASDVVLVNVTDTTSPFIFGPADFAIDHGATGSYLNWICSEPYPDYFRITRNGSLVDEGNWNGSSLQASLDGLAYGMHIFFLFLNDTYGNTANDTVNVWVIDYPIPTITPLADDIIELGSTGEYLNWSSNANLPDDFMIIHNESAVDSGPWNGSHLVVSLDDLEFGVHSFTLFINDTYGYNNTDEVIIEVVDTTPPVVDSPDNLSFDYGTTGENITWTPSDLAPVEYVVYRNGTEMLSGDWDGSQVAVNLDGLDVGVHNLTLVVFDIGGNSAKDMVLVTITAGTPTTTSSTTTTTDTTTGGPAPTDPMLVVYLGIAGALTLLVVVLLFMRTRRPKT